MSIISKNFIVVSHGEKFEFNSASWTEAFVVYLIQQALKVLLDRSSASLTKKEGHSDAERLEACKKVAERLRAGELPSRGFGQSKMSDEDYALRQALNSLMKANKGESVVDQLSRYTESLAKDQGKEYTDEMDSKVRAKLVTLAVYKKAIAERKEKAKPAPTIDIEL